jgi:hypothetical protein
MVSCLYDIVGQAGAPAHHRVGVSGCDETTLGKGILQLLRGIAGIQGEATLRG